MPLKLLPNILSFLRLILVIPFVYFFYYKNFHIAVCLFILASLTDALDGWLARVLKCQTNFGLIIDPLADKVLIVACFILLGYHQILPIWLVTLVLTRDLAITLGAAFSLFVLENKHPLLPSRLSKLNTLLQMLLIILSLITLCFDQVEFNRQILHYLVILVGFTTSASFVHYFIIWFQTFRFNHQTK
jgi:cardiolipin synthase